MKSKEGEGSTFILTMPFMVLDYTESQIPETSDYIQIKNKLWGELWEKTYNPDPTIELSNNGQDKDKPNYS